jgi:hypothetical protein
MPTEPEVLTVAQLVQRAVEVCDPDGTHEDLGELERRFEDADEPVPAVEDIEARVDEAVRSIDVDELDPALAMARAVSVYLAFRRDEIDDEPLDILRLASRAEYDGKPPPAVAEWLAEQGVA